MSAHPQACGFSHIGHREENQDRFTILDNWSEDGSFLAIVADGMGGHKGGSLAARTAISTAQKLWPRRHLYPNPKAFLSDLAKLAHQAVIAAAKSSGLSPRTTLAALYVKGRDVISMHVGDSRIMQFTKNRFIKRTRDHSLAEIHFQRGKITEAQIATHPDQNKLTKCLGQSEPVAPDFEQWTLSRDNTFVLCSDGFWSLWDNEQLGNFAHKTDAAPMLKDRITHALAKRSGHDNTTAIVVHLKGSSISLLGPLRHPTVLFSALGVVAFIGIFALLDPLLNKPTHTAAPPRPARDNTVVNAQSWNAEQFLSNLPAGPAEVNSTLPDLEAAISETEHMLENLDKPSWNTNAAAEKQKAAVKQQAEVEAVAKRQTSNKPIWEPMDAPYKGAQLAAKTIAAHLKSLGLLGPQDALRATAIDTVSPLDNTPVRVEFTQTHKGIVVLNSRLWVDIENRRMVQVGGRPAAYLMVETTPKFSFEQAAAQAKSRGIERLLPGSRQKLVIFRDKTSDHLGWMLEGEKNGQTETLILSAEDGRELFSQRTL